MVNDDLGAFTQIPAKLGTAARAFEAAQLAAKVVANPVMYDGLAVFHATHGNLVTAGAPDVTKLSATRLAMRKQTGLAGGMIDVTPRYLVVPPDLETVTEQLVATISAATVETVNPFSGLMAVVEPRLTSTSI